ncbi:hypothetical protein VULLAG_LOCUS13004 [Vulpes lagopus]
MGTEFLFRVLKCFENSGDSCTTFMSVINTTEWHDFGFMSLPPRGRGQRSHLTRSWRPGSGGGEVPLLASHVPGTATCHLVNQLFFFFPAFLWGSALGLGLLGALVCWSQASPRLSDSDFCGTQRGWLKAQVSTAGRRLWWPCGGPHPTEVWPGPPRPPHLRGPPLAGHRPPGPAPLRARDPSPLPRPSPPSPFFPHRLRTPGPTLGLTCLPPKPVCVARRAHQMSAHVSNNWGGEKFEI